MENVDDWIPTQPSSGFALTMRHVSNVFDFVCTFINSPQ